MAVALAGNRAPADLIFGQIEADVMGNAQIYFSSLRSPTHSLRSTILCSTVPFHGQLKGFYENVLCMNAINVTGNALCVYGLHMGVAGVGIPTLVSCHGGDYYAGDCA